MFYPLRHILPGIAMFLFTGTSSLQAGSFEWGGGKDTIGFWIPDSTRGHVDLLLQLSRLQKAEMARVVDSLLDEDHIHPSIIVSISHLSRRFEDHKPVPTITAFEPHPADRYYGTWDTGETHPYHDSLSAGDSTLLLVLCADSQQFVQPVTGILTSHYGYRDGRNHNGVDIDLQVWDKVVAAFDGVVRIARVDGGYGRLVVVRHYNGLETFYAHLHRFKVAAGDTVKAGQVIGLGGSSGRSTGSHLHFEVRFKGKPVNPAHIMSLREQKLISDSVVLHNQGRSYSAYPLGVAYHTIGRGDCLYTIARRYGTTINRICEMNGIRRNSVLRVGKKLRVTG